MNDGIRCSRCDQVLPADRFAPSHRKNGDWCRACRKDYNADRYTPPPRDQRPQRPPRQARPLITHGAKPSGQRWRRMQERVWAEETVCGFCGDPVDQSLHHSHPMSKTVDHITPIAEGGAMYERSNLRLAHRRCNVKAGSLVPGARASAERVQLLRAALWFGRRF